MKYLKLFESNEYEWFEVDSSDYSFNIENCHEHLNGEEVYKIIEEIYRQQQGWTCDSISNGYSIRVKDEWKTVVYYIFKNNDHYFYVWERLSSRFYKCDDLEGFEKWAKQTRLGY